LVDPEHQPIVLVSSLPVRVIIGGGIAVIKILLLGPFRGHGRHVF
jgi:hypothetical protein